MISKLQVKKVGFIAIPLLGVAILAVVFLKGFSPFSSRILLKDQEKIDKILLHNPVGTHDCHCYPPKIATNPGFRITNITATSASFRWVCDVPSTYQVSYGTTAGKGTLFPAARPAVYYTDYTVTVTGLKPGTTYHAGPSAWEKSWAKPKSWLMENREMNDWTFKTLDKTAVLRDQDVSPSGKVEISEVKSIDVSTTQATITWKTDFKSTSQVEFGTTKELDMKTGENMDMVTNHVIQLFDLERGGTYYYRVISRADPEKDVRSYSTGFDLKTEVLEPRISDTKNHFVEPNPCANNVEFNYYLYQPVNDLSIDILTLSGKKVAELQSPASSLGKGWNRVSWNVKDRSGNPLVNGLYVYIMKFTKDGTREVLKRSQFMVRR
jgi:hypothetical protein